jgi:TatD family-associated radical SAM protein
MEYAYIYGDPGRLYLNGTNRCTNRCSFCVRNYSRGLGGAVLWGGAEPELGQLQESILKRGPLEKIVEFIWCGFGEPTYRLDLITAASPWLRSHGAKIRLNTNGHACLIHGRDVLEELSRAVDEVSVSLNAPNLQKYLELCLPDSRSIADSGSAGPAPESFWQAMLDFLKRAPFFFERVQASVVGFVLTEEEIEQCRTLAYSLGVRNFRVR